MTHTDKVEVELGGTLAQHTKGSKVLEVDSGQAVSEVLVLLGIPPYQPFVALVNGQTCDLAYRLAPGDRLRFLPAISGGGQ